MKKYLKIVLIVILMGFLFPGMAEEKNPAEKKEQLKLFKRSAKMISVLDIKSAGTAPFSKQKQNIIRLLRRIVKSTNSEAQKNYFVSFIKYLKDEKFENFPKAEFIAETRSDLIVKYDKTSKSLSAIALTTHSEDNKNNDELFKKITSEIGKGIFGRNIRFFPESNVIKISEVIYSDNQEERAIVLPSSEKISSMYPGVILLKNRIENDFKNKIKPLSLEIFKKKISDGLNAGKLSRNIFLHHLAHYTIPFSIKTEGEKEISSEMV